MIMNLIQVMQEQVLGFEMKSSVYDVNINLYEAMSEIHHVNGAPEVAAGGYDAEVGALLPYLPWAKLYYKRYQWNNETKNIRHGETVSLYMEPTTRLSVEAGMQDDSTTNSHNAFIKLNYIVCCNERKAGTKHLHRFIKQRTHLVKLMKTECMKK